MKVFMDKYFMISTLREVPFVMLFFFFLFWRSTQIIRDLYKSLALAEGRDYKTIIQLKFQCRGPVQLNLSQVI